MHTIKCWENIMKLHLKIILRIILMAPSGTMAISRYIGARERGTGDEEKRTSYSDSVLIVVIRREIVASSGNYR